MPAKVTLTVTQGELAGQAFAFTERTTCLIGRADDCHPKLPDDRHHRTISRHHCLLDINPPDVRIRDFGSLNGTYVNGQKIGQREPNQTPEEAARTIFPEYDLKPGDTITLNRTVFQVEIVLPTICAECSREIPEDQESGAEISPGIYRCATCSRADTVPQATWPTQGDDLSPGVLAEPNKGLMIPATWSFRPASQVCAQCGRDVTGEVGENRYGEFLCATCKNDPEWIARLLLEAAGSGDPSLQTLRGYTLQRELGRGGMGAVFLIRHDRTGELAALKLMLPKVAVVPEARERFLRETENTRVLGHPNVVHLRSSGYAHGTFFLILEYCDGGSLAQLVKSCGGPLPVGQVAPIILQALDGLAYAHTAKVPFIPLADGGLGRGYGLVHRDIKPHNLLLAGAGSARITKVGDFGLAKAFDLAGLSGLTATGAKMGTPRFTPRPLVVDFKRAQPDVDVWAMAASFYYLVTGSSPRDFPPGTDPWLVVLTTRAVPIRRRNASIPEKLAEVIDHALIDDPAIPFKSALDFKRVLEEAL